MGEGKTPLASNPSSAVTKRLSVDKTAGRFDDAGALVLRAIELDGEPRIVPVPEGRELDRREIEQLARRRSGGRND
jgi:hypothetical protein